MAHKLPFSLSIRRLDRVTAKSGEVTAIEVETVIVDADGDSVQASPITIGGHRSAAEVASILQHHVDELAQNHFKRGSAKVEDASPEENEKAFEALKTSIFIGSFSS